VGEDAGLPDWYPAGGLPSSAAGADLSLLDSPHLLLQDLEDLPDLGPVGDLVLPPLPAELVGQHPEHHGQNPGQQQQQQQQQQQSPGYQQN
jgi:hypothetical protein